MEPEMVEHWEKKLVKKRKNKKRKVNCVKQECQRCNENQL
jgi:hypothetical protein